MTEVLEICVCTYRRPQLAETLASLMQLNQPDGYAVSILVIDNDDAPSARDAVVGMADTAPIPLRYVHCPQGNISIARNGALANSTARYLAFIDDDEVASADWLFQLLQEMVRSGADVVLGPVEAEYPAGAPGWMRRTKIHATMPVWVDDQIITGYSCNVLMDRERPALRGRNFDVSLGQTGGEDTVFFAQVVTDGGAISFAPDALLQEIIPPERARFGWLLKRRFRMGQTHGQLVSKTGTSARLWAITLCKAAYCLGAAAIQIWHPDRRNSAILRGALHVGALTGLAGGPLLRQYGPDFARRQSE